MSEKATNTPPPAGAVVVTVTEEKKDASKEEFSAQPKNKSPPLKLRHIVLPIALVTFLLSIPLFFQAIWLIFAKSDCEEFLKTLPRLQLGISIGLIVLFFLSNCIVYSRVRFPHIGLILVMLPLAVMFTIGLSLGGNLNTDSRRIPGSPRWLKMNVHGNSNWDNIKPCLYDSLECGGAVSKSFDLKPYDGFTTSKMSHLQTGCCRPPPICGMDYVNATHWRKSKRTTDAEVAAAYDEDCDLWQNEETMLCYDCHACKEGFINTLEGKWLKLRTFLVVMSMLLMLSHIVLFVGTMLEHHGG